MTKSTRSRRSGKRKPQRILPEKPSPDFPLFAHANGSWAKKIKSKTVYFGPWADPQAALDRYQQEKDALYAGKVPRDRQEEDGLRVADLVDRFLTRKKSRLDEGILSPRTFQDYYKCCERLVKRFGKDRLVTDLSPEDFEHYRKLLAKPVGRFGPVSLGNEIQRVRVIFRFAYKLRLIKEEMNYGESFERPSKKTLREERRKKGKRMFEAHQIRAMVEGALVVGKKNGGPELVRASDSLRAMIYLGLNAGLGNNDLALLPLSALDLEGGWLNYPRPKTAIDRRCPLWPETVATLREVIAKRPKAKDPTNADKVFLTRRGGLWVKATFEDLIDRKTKKKVKKVRCDDAISKEMAKLLHALGIKRPGLSFYALRHTTETIGGDCKDQIAVDAIMGHAADSGDMSQTYRETIFDNRLHGVTNHIRNWLFAVSENKQVTA